MQWGYSEKKITTGLWLVCMFLALGTAENNPTSPVIVTSPGTITSPGYPGYYPSLGYVIEYHINAPADKVIRYTVTYLDTRKNSACGRDSDTIYFYDGVIRRHDTLLAALCGSDVTQRYIITTTSEAQVYFAVKTPEGATDRYYGFTIDVEFIDKTLTRWYDGPCGISKYPDAGETQDLPDARIINGIDARDHEYPWQITFGNDTEIHWCGGSIINERWIQTAAHCSDVTDITVYVGATAPGTGESFRIVNKYIHEDFNDFTFTDDIALFYLDRPITFTDDVMPACPPDPSRDYTHLRAIASGFGGIDRNATILAEILQAVALNITDNDDCYDQWLDYTGEPFEVTEGMVCTQDNAGNLERDGCNGDSGGPLVVKESGSSTAGDVFRLVGATIYGTLPCANGFPGIYTRISTHLDWIDDIVK